ncbi:unnamed protein product [Rhizoctonia solani]|uniref:Uncharacterized protein n=1 Tax=Rhizoctonia solani TaxID=456999 RepID=A0A8H3AK90_9AGAM|nr:unnamed protein product [Rhizoctonia solani]
MLVAVPRRMTKAKLAELSENARAREEAVMNDKLTQAQREELDALRHQVAGGNDMNEVFLYNTPENNLVGAENDSADTEWEVRLKTVQNAWEGQIPALCNAYLDFLSGSTSGADLGGLLVEEQVKVHCISLWSEETKLLSLELAQSDTTSSALIKHGFISPSPTRPTVAISIKILYILEATQQRCPSASIQGMAKAFCDLRNVPFKPYFRTQLSAALDVYYMIQREVQQRLDKALGLDSPELKLKTCCPPCTKKLPKEPSLHYSMLVTSDGGDSFKRCNLAGAIDKRNYESDYYISRAEVDKFEDEVVRSKKGKEKEKESEVSECEKRWKNAKADKQPDKKTKSYFEETGLFVSLCRHSFVLTVCDMVRSGEKAKYALATINRLISTFGNGILMGYDIGCTMKGTVARSQLLGPKAAKLQFDMCVGSFHGAAHRRACQLQNHPQNRLGAGLSDLENAETFFSYANRIAASTRLASGYHRHQRIDMLIKTWNGDMYEALGSLLRRKYIAALKTIDSANEFLSHSSNVVEEIEGYFKDEVDYMGSFKKDLPSDTFKINYIGLLEQLEIKEDEFNSCLNAKPAGGDTSNLHRLALFKSCLEAKRRALLEQLTTLQKAVQKIEEEHGLNRWTHGSTDWKEAQTLRDNQHFHTCVDTLEHLVVQRLLELSRAGLANTGYKLRQQIARSIATRSGAIKTALAKYNAAAAELKPPAPEVTWEQINNASVLADFEILHGSRRNVLDQAWTKPKNHRCVEQLHRLQRAHEEIKRLNIELLRLRTSIVDEENQSSTKLKELRTSKSPLFAVLQRFTIRRIAVNTMLLHELQRIKDLPGYTGSKLIGSRSDSSLGSEIRQPQEESPQSHAHEAQDLEASASIDPEGSLEIDDDIADQFDRWQGMLDCAKAS